MSDVSIPSAIVIRRASSDDAADLAALAERTFIETFGAANRAEDLAAHVAHSYSPAIQARELADPQTTYLLAEVDGASAGFALLRVGETPACVRGSAPIELHRFYVDRPWHGRGVAAALMTAAVAEARDKGGRTLWLGVWEHNPRAIRFYEKQGFRDTGAQLFHVGADPQTDRVMVRSL